MSDSEKGFFTGIIRGVVWVCGLHGIGLSLGRPKPISVAARTRTHAFSIAKVSGRIYHGTVHRASTLFLLAVIGFSLIAPGVLLDAASTLPACCRRSGTHRCMTKTDEPATHAGESFQASRQTCPLFPSAITAPARSSVGLPGHAAAFFAALLSHPSIQFQTEARYRVSCSRSHQKRGPPAILS
jgi:hypothetical protein